MLKLSIERLSLYLKAKKDYDDLKEYYDRELKAAEEEHLYSLKAVRYDGVKVDGGQHTDIADKIARYEEWREQTDKHCEFWLDYNKRCMDSRKEITEKYIDAEVPWKSRIFDNYEQWKNCNVPLLQEVLRLKYLECKTERDIATALKITGQEVANMLYTYTELTDRPPKRGRKNDNKMIIK